MSNFDVISLFKDEVEMAEEDLVAMEYALEDCYAEKLAENLLYFNESPEQLKDSNDLLLKELTELEEEFKAKEEFEKCSVVKKVIDKVIIPGIKKMQEGETLPKTAV